MKTPNGPEHEDQQSPGTEIVPGMAERIKAKELRLGRKLEILDKNGAVVVALRKNLTGNTEEEKSYTLELMGDNNVLVPVPYFAPFAGFSIETFANEDVELTVPKDSKNKFSYRFHDGPKDISEIRPRDNELNELTKEWSEFALANDECLVFYSADKEVLARIHKAANSAEYILRDARGKAHDYLFEGEEAESGKPDNKLYFGVNGGKFRIKGDPKILLSVEKLTPFQKIDTGGANSFDADSPHILRGLINGGRAIAIASYREVGAVKDALLMRNEDSAGSNADTAVVADGLGGHFHGSLIASEAVDALLNGKGNFKKDMQNVHDRMFTYTSFYRQKIEAVRDFDEDAEWSAFAKKKNNTVPPATDANDKFEKELSIPDTVMAAVKFEGDMMETMVLGDSRVFVVRGDKVVFRSKVHSYVEEQVARGHMTRRQALESQQRSIVTTTLVGAFVPDFRTFQLMKGDKVILCSDGGEMRDELLVECVRGFTAEEGVKNLLIEKRDENLNGGDYYPDGEGGVVRQVSKDNTSYVVIDHD